MMFAALLSPLGLIGLLLGMERLERWTVRQSQPRRRPPASSPCRRWPPLTPAPPSIPRPAARASLSTAPSKRCAMPGKFVLTKSSGGYHFLGDYE